MEMKRLGVISGIAFIAVVMAVLVLDPCGWRVPPPLIAAESNGGTPAGSTVDLLNSEGQTIVREHIKPRHIIAVHLSPADNDQVSEQIKQGFPNAIAFTRLLEKKSY